MKVTFQDIALRDSIILGVFAHLDLSWWVIGPMVLVVLTDFILLCLQAYTEWNRSRE